MVIFITVLMILAIVISAVLDAESSEKVFKLGGFELNPLFGSKQPSRLRFYSYYLLFDGGRYVCAAILSHGLRVYGHPLLAYLPTVAMSLYLAYDHFKGYLGNRKIYVKK